MPINYAEKYAPYVDERFKKQSLSNGAVNQDLEWVGVETVKVFSIPTVAMRDYSLPGMTRSGVHEELQSSVQEM